MYSKHGASARRDVGGDRRSMPSPSPGCSACLQTGDWRSQTGQVSATAGGMNLADYLLQHQLSPAEFARRIGVGRMSVHRYLRGERFPRPHVLRRIRAVTAGHVTADDFVDVTDAESHPNGRTAHRSSDAITQRRDYPWSRTTARERRGAEAAFARMMQEPPEGEDWSPTIRAAFETLGDRARFLDSQFQLDDRVVRAATLVTEANRLRQDQGLPSLRYPGVPE